MSAAASNLYPLYTQSALKESIYDYDIILVMTNKDSQKFIQPIIKYLEKK